MRIFIVGIDGYLGWPLALYLAQRGHRIAGTDCYHRRSWVAEMGSQSAIPIEYMDQRLKAFKQTFNSNLEFSYGNITDYNFVHKIIKAFQPETIVHLAQMPSAPGCGYCHRRRCHHR